VLAFECGNFAHVGNFRVLRVVSDYEIELLHGTKEAFRLPESVPQCGLRIAIH